MGSSRAYSYPPGEIVPLEKLRGAFPDFDVKEGDFIKRDGKLFRVNSTGMQVEWDKWRLDEGSGEFHAIYTKQKAGYNRVEVSSFSERFQRYDELKRRAKEPQQRAALIFFCYTIPAIPLIIVLLIERHHHVRFAFGLVAVAGLLGGLYWLLRRSYEKKWTDEALIGPEPLRRRVSDFGDKIRSPRTVAPSAMSDDYQIPL
jgi:hypothetical protein